MPYKVLEIQSTPNPNAMKFVLDQVIAVQPASFYSAPAAQHHPIATALFEIPGVSSVLLLNDFVTVNRRPEIKWQSISPKVLNVLKKF
jgi:hypothetical protein